MWSDKNIDCFPITMLADKPSDHSILNTAHTFEFCKWNFLRQFDNIVKFKNVVLIAICMRM